MFESLAKSVALLLEIWRDDKKHALRDRLLELKKEWYEAYNRTGDQYSDAVLDSCELELRLINDTVCSGVAQQNAQN